MIPERRDDWHHGVDENLASLNAGQRVWERENDHTQKMLAELDQLLRGDTEEGTSGLIGRLEAIEHDLSRLNAVIFVDSTGKKGILHDVESLAKREKTSGERWKFATALVVAFLSLLGLILTNLDRMEGFLWRKTKSIQQKSEKPTKISRRKHYVIRVPPPTETETENDDDQP